ncbi:HesA/MoeB/ThiF family protein [Actinophytocola sp.]|uniref:HesA/MoeB/ThiF family protein n=1 Tax=Actinophytocola sp. TaxID=1872138 RepID=UPI003D6BAC89
MLFSQPRVKPEAKPLRLTNGAIRIGGLVYGVAAEIDDPTGAVWSLLQAMDGTRGVDDIMRLMHDRFPDEDPPTIRDAISQLCESGYLEDAAAQAPTLLSECERERYSRSQGFYRGIDLTPRTDPWHAQHRLRSATVTVLGLGGTGGAAALALCASGVGRLHCVDMDRVELSNLNRQLLYTEDDLGERKSDAAIARLAKLNSDITVTGENRQIRGPEDLRDLIDACDVFVLSADTPNDLDLWVNEECLRSNTPWVEGGYSGAHVTATAFLPGQGACHRCTKLTSAERLPAPVDQKLDLKTPPANAVTAATAALAGNLGAHLALSIITGIPRVTSGTVHGFDLGSLQNQFSLHHERRADCPACSGMP